MPIDPHDSTEQLVIGLACMLVDLQERVQSYGGNMVNLVRSAGAVILELDRREPDWLDRHADAFHYSTEFVLAEYGVTFS